MIKPTPQPPVYNSNDDAKKALQNGQVDALVVDLPTAFYITAAELDNGEIVGQLPHRRGTPEQFGLVLDKDSPLTACVSQAVDALRADGTLDDAGDSSGCRRRAAAPDADVTPAELAPAAGAQRPSSVPPGRRHRRARRSPLVAAACRTAGRSRSSLVRRPSTGAPGLAAGAGDVLRPGDRLGVAARRS